MLDRPYFMSNPEWYEYDFEKDKYVLTAKATDKAKESYKKYHEDLKEAEKMGIYL